MLIVGLGNPGKEYERTFHNVGFLCVDEICKALNGEFNLKLAMQLLQNVSLKVKRLF